MSFETDDVLGRLFDRRIVMATGPLDGALVDRVTAQLLSLDADAVAPIELVIDCPTAELDPAFTLLDVCDALTAPLTIVVAGRLVGAGIVLLTSRHRRLGRPHARLQLSEPHLEQTNTTAQTVSRLVEEHRRRVGLLYERLSDRTTRPVPLIADDMSRGVYLTSEEAVTYGLLDEVLRRPVQ